MVRRERPVGAESAERWREHRLVSGEHAGSPMDGECGGEVAEVPVIG
jgi:hypothetical protein